MKKLIYSLTAIILLGLSVNTSVAASKKEKQPLTEQQSAQMRVIQQRVEEIRAMDKSNLTKEQRKELKKELRTMNGQARAITGGGIYLSAGAIIVIILVLILIL